MSNPFQFVIRIKENPIYRKRDPQNKKQNLKMQNKYLIYLIYKFHVQGNI